MQNPASTVQPKTQDKPGQKSGTPLPAPLPLSPDLLQQVGGAGGPRGLPKGGW